jgi:hypothetical protein
MRQFIIIKKQYPSEMFYWEAHRYNILYRIFGPTTFTLILDSLSITSEEDCKKRVMNIDTICRKYQEIIRRNY